MSYSENDVNLELQEHENGSPVCQGFIENEPEKANSGPLQGNLEQSLPEQDTIKLIVKFLPDQYETIREIFIKYQISRMLREIKIHGAKVEFIREYGRA